VRFNAQVAAAAIVGFSLAFVFASNCQTHADASQPALDRQLVERMTRALEAQAAATKELVRVTERCRR